MNLKKLQTQILENAKTLVALHNKISETYKSQTTNLTAWQNACYEFESQYNKLAFPGGLKEELIALKDKNLQAITDAIEFLKADPYYHRSGYNKQKIAHLLKSAPLTKEQIKELQKCIIKAIEKKQFFCAEYARLARQIQDPEFKTQIKSIIQQASDRHKIYIAKKILIAMNS
jgi:hypothetical protein